MSPRPAMVLGHVAVCLCCCSRGNERVLILRDLGTHCLSYTITSSPWRPRTSVRTLVARKIVPSADMTVLSVKITFPCFFQTLSLVRWLILLTEMVSASGEPLSG